MKNFLAIGLIFIAGLTCTKGIASGGGNVVGNGGDAFVCKDGRVVFFDVYEAQKGRGLKLDLGPSELDFYDKVEFVIQRVPDSLFDWKRMLRQGVLEFRERSRFDDFDLEDIKDTDNIITMPGCELKQAVVQHQPVLDVDPIFFVNQKIWEKMDNDSKAALVLHEVIYRYAIQAGAKNSVGTRALNSYLMAATLPYEATCLFTRALGTLNLRSLIPSIRLNGLVIDGLQAVVDNQCRVSHARVQSGTVTVEGQEMTPIYTQSDEFRDEWGLDGLSLLSPFWTEWIQFHSQYPMTIGPHQVILAGERTAALWGKSRNWAVGLTAGRKPLSRPGYVRLSRTGEVIEAAVEEMQTSLMGQTVSIRGDVVFAPETRVIERIDFTEAGTLVLNGISHEVEWIEYQGYWTRPGYLVKVYGKDITLAVNLDGSTDPSID